MDDATRKEYETKSQTLRAELKTWETSWAKTHEGKKPSRDDIKQNPDIAQKYKYYNKLRDVLSGKEAPPSKSTTSSPSRKRKSSSSAPVPVPAYTPSKRLRTTPSISRTALLPNEHTTPSLNRKLFFSPASAKVPTPTSIGPTPQRDGKVLGLFDLLPEETPSRPRTGGFITEQPLLQNPLASTPRKRHREDDDPRSGSTTTPAAHRHGGRTPMSTSKRAMLDNFMFFTPLKNRDGNAAGGPMTSFAARIGISAATTKTTTSTDKENGLTTPKGPRSVSKSLFATPAFLKRHHAKPLDPVSETGEEEEEAIRPLRLPRKPLARGLSSIAAGLRKLEEERLDDEMEAMREAEMEMEGYSVPPPAKKVKAVVDDRTDLEREAEDGFPVEVEDSQLAHQDQGQEKEKPVLLGGFDDEGLLDSDVEEQLDRGQPLRVYQKKGQKRTTRRHNMKPTRARRPTANAEEAGSDEEDEVVPETQHNAAATGLPDEEDDYNLLSGSDFDDDEDDQTQKEKKAKAKAAATAKKDKEKKKKDGGKEGEGKEKEGTVKKAVRKVKATANANFKRLKLKNYGAKGAPVNSRFRRRR